MLMHVCSPDNAHVGGDATKHIDTRGAVFALDTVAPLIASLFVRSHVFNERTALLRHADAKTKILNDHVHRIG